MTATSEGVLPISAQPPGNAAPVEQDAARLRVSAAFCRYGAPISSTVATAPRPARSDDPEFRRFLHAIVFELMPAVDRINYESSDCTNRRNC